MTRKGIKLVAPDNNGILCYQGNCKLKVDTLSKMLKVEPKNEEYNDISALFQWKFIQKKNLFFVFAESRIQDFVLIFANEETCKTVYDRIYKKREKDSIEKEELQLRLLIPVFQIISKNATRFKKAMFEWIEKHEENEKNKLLKLLKEQKRNNQILDIKNIKQESKNLINPRKRRFSEMTNYNSPDADEEEYSESLDGNLNNVKTESDEIQFQRERLPLSTANKIIDESLFKIVNVKNQSGFYRKLLIFTSAERTKCFEYTFFPSKLFFNHLCNSYANGIKAVLKLNEEGKECIGFEDKPHVCSPLKYHPKRYMEIKIVKKPDYEIIENCSQKSKRMLIIFNPEDRNFCYEYYWYSKHNKFVCCGCCNLKRQNIVAEIVHENTEKEYIRLINNQHVCEIRKYNPKKFNRIYKYVLPPNFEIQTKIKNGIERKTLIIFDESNRKLCYKYFFGTSTNVFYCCGCYLKRKTVSARLSQNDDGVEYVILSNAEHVCSLQTQTEKILRPPKFKFFEATEKNSSKLIIFDPNNNQLCYIFSPNSGESRFQCLGCLQIARRKRKLPSGNECESKQIVSVYLCKNDSSNDGAEYYVKMLDNQKHICEPRKYEPEKFKMKILKPKDDYILIKIKKNGLPSLIIYDPNDKQFCFKYYYRKFGKLFRCHACEMKKTRVTAELHRDCSNGNEYILLNQKKHVCSPIKTSTIVNSNTVILEKIDLFLKETKLRMKKFDESQIIRIPNFELQRNIKGVPDRKLIIFKNDDKELCYEFGYHKALFECNKCKITAKLHHNSENGEKYIVLSNDEHKCEPVKYVPNMKIIKAPNFKIFNRDDENKPTKLIIFTSETKDFCYEYYFFQKRKYFQCCGCSTLKKTVSAKLVECEDGEEYIQLLKNDHLCEPKKFVSKEFQPKIVLESGFKLCPNKNGKPNSKLILFDSKKDGFCYEYYLSRNLFKCNQCSNKKKRVTAKLCEKQNGEKYVQLSKNDHICIPKKFVLEEFQPKIISESGFKLFCNQNGKPNSKLIIFGSNKDEFCYEYFLESKNLFICNQCTNKKKRVTAKLYEKEGGEKYLELSNEEHICKSAKYDPENYNENEKKIVFNNFVVQHNTNGDPNSRLTIFEENDKYFGYQYSFYKSRNAFVCCECRNKKHRSTTAKLLIDGNGKQTVKFSKNEHVCEIQNFKEKNIIFEHFNFEESGNILIATHPMQNGKYYKFKFDNQVDAYCCIKCKEKKKIITATVCNGNDGKEFRLLNGVHCCVPFSN